MKIRDHEKNLKKSSLAAAYTRLSDPVIKEALLAEYEALCAESELADKMLARHLLYAILPAIAFYRVLPKQGYTKETAASFIRESVFEAAAPSAKFFQAMGRIPFFYSLLRLICPAVMKSSFGKTGWQIEWKENNRRRISFDAHTCFYEKTLKKYNAMELLIIFCDVDDLTYGSIPKITWGRTKTMGKGYGVCDFCFINERNLSQT
jgi:hypothetical protein